MLKYWPFGTISFGGGDDGADKASESEIYKGAQTF
jgi:hypothetical protein